MQSIKMPGYRQLLTSFGRTSQKLGSHILSNGTRNSIFTVRLFCYSMRTLIGALWKMPLCEVLLKQTPQAGRKKALTELEENIVMGCFRFQLVEAGLQALGKFEVMQLTSFSNVGSFVLYLLAGTPVFAIASTHHNTRRFSILWNGVQERKIKIVLVFSQKILFGSSYMLKKWNADVVVLLLSWVTMCTVIVWHASWSSSLRVYSCFSVVIF